jgi:hypothetical protein
VVVAESLSAARCPWGGYRWNGRCRRHHRAQAGNRGADGRAGTAVSDTTEYQ